MDVHTVLVRAVKKRGLREHLKTEHKVKEYDIGQKVLAQYLSSKSKSPAFQVQQPLTNNGDEEDNLPAFIELFDWKAYHSMCRRLALDCCT